MRWTRREKGENIDSLWKNDYSYWVIPFKKPKGGDTVSTGIKKLRLHAEVPFARKTDGYNTNADDYAYAVAA